jgi:hypothetical protein
MCMTDHPGGYCIKMCDIKNNDADCPSGAACQSDGMAMECHKECSNQSDCRTGYVCAPASMTPTNTVSHAICDMPAPSDASTGMSSDGSGSSSGGRDSGSDVLDAGAPDAPAMTCITPTTPQPCAAPVGTALPICKLSQTGCMDAKNPTHVAATAVYYEVNSPLWSDNAAKTRAFVLPAGGKIHVKNCDGDAGASAECTSPMGVHSGSADDDKWLFPVGTVMIKSFLFDGKLVETRLFMHVDKATAGIIQNGFGSEWVGYNYQWNEQQTEATIVPNARIQLSFNTGQRTVSWVYPSFADCIGCHSPAVATLGLETAQMNRVVNGANQIDTFKTMGLFDGTAPAKPYAAPLVEPYVNAALGLTKPTAGATVDQMARSYLSANCGFCHRPDVNDHGFDLRHKLSLYDTKICNLVPLKPIPGMAQPPAADFVPGNHAGSDAWQRMNIPVPANDPTGMLISGRMPPVASYVVDSQATALIGTWIDSIKTCPTSADAGL